MELKIKLANAERKMSEVVNWTEDIRNNESKPVLDHIKDNLKARQVGKAAVEEFIGDDPMLMLFRDTLMRYEGEVQERILDLVEKGEDSPTAYYAILRETLGRESNLADVLPTAESIEPTMLTSCAVCTSCVSCAQCILCLMPGVAVVGVFTAVAATTAANG